MQFTLIQTLFQVSILFLTLWPPFFILIRSLTHLQSELIYVDETYFVFEQMQKRKTKQITNAIW